jgi:preprotein translocase subunit SecF
MIWGIVVGTYSSLFIASPILILFNLRAASVEPVVAETAEPQ